MQRGRTCAGLQRGELFWLAQCEGKRHLRQGGKVEAITTRERGWRALHARRQAGRAGDAHDVGLSVTADAWRRSRWNRSRMDCVVTAAASPAKLCLQSAWPVQCGPVVGLSATGLWLRLSAVLCCPGRATPLCGFQYIHGVGKVVYQ
jgi:hypothetical protein